MSTCKGCGGTVGRDCFNPQECEWISSDQQRRHVEQQFTEERFQARVQPWMMECFGPVIAADRIERNHRFLEESLELVQACGCTEDEARQLVNYVYGRPVGEVSQEVGGVMVTLAALCLAQGIDMHTAGETELARIWTKVEVIRAKQAAKPKHSPLPEAAEQMGGAQVDAQQRAPLDDFEKWLKGRGALGPGPLTERIFIAGWLAGNRRAAPTTERAAEGGAPAYLDYENRDTGYVRGWNDCCDAVSGRAAEGEATSERKPLTIVEAKAEAAAPEAPDDAQGTPYFRDVEFDPPSGLFTTITSLGHGIGSDK